SHVFNFELPNVAEQYVHRIGRTARAGADGIAINLVSPDEKAYLRDIEKLTRVKSMPLPLPEDFTRQAASLPAPSRKPENSDHERRPQHAHGRGPKERAGEGQAKRRFRPHGKSAVG